jgi:hypothetical protein
MMKTALVVVGLICSGLIARGETRDLGLCERSYESALEPGTHLRIDARSGDIDIVGSSEPRLVVTCDVDHSRNPRSVQIQFTSSPNSADLRISGGPRDRFRMRIQVPDHLNLTVRGTAGDLDLEGVTGDKDISLRAGDLTIQVGSPEDYARTEASVKAGDLRARAFGVNKGGLFRSFKHTNPNGKYRLEAHLIAGDLTLK